MTWEPRPLPDVTPESDPFWSGAADGELRLSECVECGLVYHYPRALCPDCLSDDITWRTADGTGEIYAYSVTETVDGWPDRALPHVVAYVELDEGPRMITNVVDCDPDKLRIGTPVEVTFVDTETDISIPVFTLR